MKKKSIGSQMASLRWNKLSKEQKNEVMKKVRSARKVEKRAKKAEKRAKSYARVSPHNLML